MAFVTLKAELEEYETHRDALEKMGVSLEEWQLFDRETRDMKLKTARDIATMKGV